MLYQHTGTTSYIADDKTGFYPQNLLMAYPFLVKAFLNTGYFETKFLMMGYPLAPYYAICSIITLLILIKTFSYLYKQLKQPLTAAADESVITLRLSRFAVYVVAISIVLLLSALSVYYYPQVKAAGGAFTYVKESRYFIVSSLLLLILFAGLVQNYFSGFAWSFRFSIRKLAFASVLLINLSLYGKFLFNASTNNLVDHIGRRTENRHLVQQEIELLINQYKMPVVAASEDKDIIYYPNIKSYGVIRNFKELLKKGVHTSQPVQVVLVTHKKLSNTESNFVQEKGAKEVFSNKYYRIFHFIAENKASTVAMLY